MGRENTVEVAVVVRNPHARPVTDPSSRDTAINRHEMDGKGTPRIVTTWHTVHKLTTERTWHLRPNNGRERHPAGA